MKYFLSIDLSVGLGKKTSGGFYSKKDGVVNDFTCRRATKSHGSLV